MVCDKKAVKKKVKWKKLKSYVWRRWKLWRKVSEKRNVFKGKYIKLFVSCQFVLRNEKVLKNGSMEEGKKL